MEASGLRSVEELAFASQAGREAAAKVSDSQRVRGPGGPAAQPP